jgi:putative toxin-antitoxin system antitoxin component (TIGR02293 family)
MDKSILTRVTNIAIEVFGCDAAARQWLATSAIGLDSCRPIDLIDDPEGAERVVALLIRIDYCVYT